jgi:2-methylcitrate dehydratase PrpD
MAAEDMPGDVPILFDGRTSSASGAAMANGMMIDSLDGHDGYNDCKGHIGCPVLPAMLSFAHGTQMSGEDFLTALVVGYEIGGRTGVAQHATCPDYHTSGSWGAVAGAAVGVRMAGFDAEHTRHALGIAEYHGPRSQMMRCIDHPTMLKDGSGWGALCAVSAVQLARRGFTGAPAITVEEAPEFWGTLGDEWITLAQYFKPYPVCRWAQAPVEGVLALARAHDLTSGDVDQIVVETFHEACRLATARPATTEEAQYSTSFPCAVALVRGAIRPEDVAEDALQDPEVLRLSEGLHMREHDFANQTFPAQRHARVALKLKDGRTVQGDWMNPLWTADVPPTDAELITKFHDLADGPCGAERAGAIRDAVFALDATALSALTDPLSQPIKS